VGRTVALVLRDTRMRFFSSSRSMADHTDLPDEIYHTACDILYRHWDENRAVRLVGVTLGNLVKREHLQCDIFGERMRLSKLARACDAIKDRFGERAIMRGVSLTEESINRG
ncbi:MAG: DNA polymerase IV, partial [Firmicutes bacterium]|nr:DNA polymerase IV [Bacillota bacterium]